ncbi:hypothetical protein J6590_007265 [Homalodisca vitripennis]|nr:hypothetical protein J6590_007265 [Homalodisca vitripennis]
MTTCKVVALKFLKKFRHDQARQPSDSPVHETALLVNNYIYQLCRLIRASIVFERRRPADCWTDDSVHLQLNTVRQAIIACFCLDGALGRSN